MRNSWTTWVLVAVVSMTWTGCLYQDLEVLEVEEFSKVKLSFDGLEFFTELALHETERWIKVRPPKNRRYR